MLIFLDAHNNRANWPHTHWRRPMSVGNLCNRTNVPENLASCNRVVTVVASRWATTSLWVVTTPKDAGIETGGRRGISKAAPKDVWKAASTGAPKAAWMVLGMAVGKVCAMACPKAAVMVVWMAFRTVAGKASRKAVGWAAPKAAWTASQKADLTGVLMGALLDFLKVASMAVWKGASTDDLTARWMVSSTDVRMVSRTDLPRVAWTVSQRAVPKAFWMALGRAAPKAAWTGAPTAV